MTSEVTICNQALTLVAGNQITSLDDDSTEAKLCKLNYPEVRDAVLSEHNWTFATVWETLAQVADPPPGEFTNGFAIPSDTLTVLFVGQDYRHPDPDWQIEGELVRTNSTTCKAQLLKQVTDTTRYSPLFTQALVARLAAEICIPITESRSLMENLFSMYNAKVRKAASRDGQQGRNRRIRSTWLSNARYRDGTRWAGPYV